MQKKKKKKKKDKKKESFQVADTKIVWFIGKISIQREIQIQFHWTKLDLTKWREESMKLGSVARVLNPFNEVWCDD